MNFYELLQCRLVVVLDFFTCDNLIMFRLAFIQGHTSTSHSISHQHFIVHIGRIEVEKVRAAAKEELESAVAAVEARAAADAAAQVDKVRTEARAELEREVAALKVAAATDAAAQVEAAAETERIEVDFLCERRQRTTLRF